MVGQGLAVLRRPEAQEDLGVVWQQRTPAAPGESALCPEAGASCSQAPEAPHNLEPLGDGVCPRMFDLKERREP